MDHLGDFWIFIASRLILLILTLLRTRAWGVSTWGQLSMSDIFGCDNVGMLLVSSV